MIMTEARPSIDSIVMQWSEGHGNRFRKDNRQPAIRELIELFVHYGYERWQIESEITKAKVMKHLVGPTSPRGSSGLRQWRTGADKDWKLTIYQVFEPIEKPTGPVHITYQPSSVSQQEQDRLDQELLKEFQETTAAIEAAAPKPHPVRQLGKQEEPMAISDTSVEEDVYSNDVVIRPELDRSRFTTIQTTPVESVEDLLADLESRIK